MRWRRSTGGFPDRIPAVKTGLLPVLSAIVAVAAAGCSNLGGTVDLAPDEVRGAMPTQEFNDVTITHTDKGLITFVVQAPRLERFQKPSRAVLSGGIRVRFYDEGRPGSVLTAERGEVRDNGRELLAEGHVVVDTDSGTVIKTPRLTWRREDELIRSDTVVTIITRWDTLYGTGLIASQDLRRRRILQPKGVSRRAISTGEGAATGNRPAGEPDGAAGRSYMPADPSARERDTR